MAPFEWKSEGECSNWNPEVLLVNWCWVPPKEEDQEIVV